MPFLAKHPIGHAFNVVFTLALLAALVGLSYHSLAKDRADEKYQRRLPPRAGRRVACASLSGTKASRRPAR